MFWENYIKLCVEKGESPNTVAAKCGVKSSGTVTGWKNGATPRDSVIQKLAVYFGVDKQELLKEKNSPANNNGGVSMSSHSILLQFVEGLTEEQSDYYLPQILNLILNQKIPDSHE